MDVDCYEQVRPIMNEAVKKEGLCYGAYREVRTTPADSAENGKNLIRAKMLAVECQELCDRVWAIAVGRRQAAARMSSIERQAKRYIDDAYGAGDIAAFPQLKISRFAGVKPANFF